MSKAVEVERCKVVELRSSSKDGSEAGRWGRFFTKENLHPFDEIRWKIVDAKITNKDGKTVFEQSGVEVPEWWSQNTVNIVADKYFRIVNGVKERSMKQTIKRVASAMRSWAAKQKYFNSEEDAKIYEDELCYILLHQYGAFNSPVWFNIGIPGRKQQASACFISSVNDTLNDIMEFQKSEVEIFAGGSGSGANLSNLRSSWEKLSSGAYVSGTLSWMEGFDKFAKAMKSGGSTRNAAKIIVLDMDHPDILETRDGRPGFIRCKAAAEKIAHDLAKLGYGVAYDDPNSVYKLVPFQNANHSVSVSDAFMEALKNDGEWKTVERTRNKRVHTYKARELWREISEAAWICGDPGIQFTDTINGWHTTPAAGRIRSSNPCFSANTRVATEFGLVPIADLYEQVMDKEVGVAVRIGDQMVVRPAVVFPTGMNPIMRVEFRSGRVLEVTPSHEFLLRDGTRKPACRLTTPTRNLDEPASWQPGDVVDIQCSEGTFGTFDQTIQDANDWYRIAGFIVGDERTTKVKVNNKWHRGSDDTDKHCIPDRYEVGLCFGKDGKDCLENVEAFLLKKEIPHTIRRQNGSICESPDYVGIHRKTIFDLMEKTASPVGCKSHTKRIQPGVFRASKNSQFAFLSGLFSANDTFSISAKGNNGKIPTKEMRLSSVNLDLLRDVQALLLNLGIKSIIQQNGNAANHGVFNYTTASGQIKTYDSSRSLHELFVDGHSLRRLRDGIKNSGGMLSARKQAQLDAMLPEGCLDPIHDIWHDEVVSVTETGRVELTYNMTESETHTIIAEGVKIPQCSEFLNVDNTACNLAAINLTKFFDGEKLNLDCLEHVVRVLVTAQNAVIDVAEYPTKAIADNSKKLRPIGLNYGNLGSLIMKLGYGYDSDEGRAVAARMSSLMTGIAYLVSARLAAKVGPFPAFDENHDAMMHVMSKHIEADSMICHKWNIQKDPLGDEVKTLSASIWKEAVELGKKYGYTVSQATLQAPLGTLSFLMEMDTTGVEPAFSLVTYKSLVGGGNIKLTCAAVREALLNLGYHENEVSLISKYIEENDCIEGAPSFKIDHLPIFDCAMPSGKSKRCLTPMAHVKMLAAIQPLITCAISKTVNLPESTTVEEISDIYIKAWEMGVKCIALYRDKCKMSQPLVTKTTETQALHPPKLDVKGQRRCLPSDLNGRRHRFAINGFKGYIIMNDYPDGALGEVFLHLGKTGTTIAGFVDGFTQLLSIALQYGVPLDKMIRSFINTKFDPSGFTDNPQIRFADSLYDYLFKLLDIKYYNGRNSGLEARLSELSKGDEKKPSIHPDSPAEFINASSPICQNCGSITKRVGTCYLCSTCGTSSGCS